MICPPKARLSFFPSMGCTRGVHSVPGQARLPLWRWRQTNRSARCGQWRWLLRFVGFAPAGCLRTVSRCFFLQIPDETWVPWFHGPGKNWIVAVGSLITKLQSPVFYCYCAGWGDKMPVFSIQTNYCSYGIEMTRSMQPRLFSILRELASRESTQLPTSLRESSTW